MQISIYLKLAVNKKVCYEKKIIIVLIVVFILLLISIPMHYKDGGIYSIKIYASKDNIIIINIIKLIIIREKEIY